MRFWCFVFFIRNTFFSIISHCLSKNSAEIQLIQISWPPSWWICNFCNWFPYTYLNFSSLTLWDRTLNDTYESDFRGLFRPTSVHSQTQYSATMQENIKIGSLFGTSHRISVVTTGGGWVLTPTSIQNLLEICTKWFKIKLTFIHRGARTMHVLGLFIAHQDTSKEILFEPLHFFWAGDATASDRSNTNHDVGFTPTSWY